VDVLDDVLAETDAVMVARGDLGVEIGPALVPLVQKRIIHKALERGKPVITATQMLETMVHSPEPTGPRRATSRTRSSTERPR
jgi:pyruvate kinase